MIKFKADSPLKSLFYKIKLLVNNNLIFEGLIDEQISSKFNSDLIIKIVARSKACLLLDNQAKPQTYNNISLKNILDNHILPFGFSYNKIDPSLLSASLESFTVFPNMSEWAVLESFLDKALCLFAFVSDNDEIRLSDHFENSDISISNNINKNLVSFVKNFNYSNISVCLKKTCKKNNIISKRCSSDLKNIQNINFKSDNILSIKISLPNLFFSSVGKKILVIDDLINSNLNNSLFVIKKLYYIFKNNHIYSYLSLFPDF